MNAMSIDTRKAVRDLRASGADEPLADAIVDLFRQAADLPDVAELATKADIAVCKAEIRTDIAEMKAAIDGKIADLDTRLGGRIAGVETRIATIDAKMAMLMWMIGILGGGALVLQVLTSTLRLFRLG